MRKYNSSNEPNITISDTIKTLKQKALKRRKSLNKTDLDRPISFWTKDDRLIEEVGKEFTIILRTKGCSWSLGSSGGCSMCGYIQDAYIEGINQNHIKNQIDFAISHKINEITKDDEKYALKIFNSGSFFDNNEISDNLRQYIYDRVVDIENIKEVTFESRLNYITIEKLRILKENLKNKYIEVAIGIETVNDYIRNCYINKGMKFNDFRNVVETCKEMGIGIKAYLLLKPLFLNESGAIDDCINSIRTLVDLKINTISINPLNVQRGTLVEYLWYQNKYRPPWFHSLFKVLKKSVTQNDLINLRIISDPSGAGTKRGIHNCLKKECETAAQKMLKDFVFSQELNSLESNDFECDCKRIYQLQKQFS